MLISHFISGSMAYAVLVTFITAMTMTLVHERVPDPVITSSLSSLLILWSPESISSTSRHIFRQHSSHSLGIQTCRSDWTDSVDHLLLRSCSSQTQSCCNVESSCHIWNCLLPS